MLAPGQHYTEVTEPGSRSTKAKAFSGIGFALQRMPNGAAGSPAFFSFAMCINLCAWPKPFGPNQGSRPSLEFCVGNKKGGSQVERETPQHKTNKKNKEEKKGNTVV